MKTRIISILLALIFPLLAVAVAVPNLYQGEVAVASYSANDWQKAIVPAFNQVLVKVSGDPNISQVAAIRPMLSRAGSFVQSYNYTSVDGGNGKTTIMLQARFSPKAVNNLLQRNLVQQKTAQPVLAEDRPASVVWIVLTDGSGQTSLLNEENLLLSTLQKDAENMAIPVLWPSMDLEDLQAISAQQVLNFEQEAAIRASQRYNAEAILLGTIAQIANNSWQGKWLWISPQGNQSWQTDGTTANQVASNMLKQLAVVSKPTVIEEVIQ